MPNVGNLNATLSLSAWEFNSGLKQSETAAIEFATTTEVQSRRAETAMRRISGSSGASALPGIFTQAGFALQDFSSQFSTRGLAGGIGAITNNIQAMGSQLGAANAATIAIGAAVTGIILPPMLEWLAGTKEIEQQYGEIEKRIASTAARAKEVAQLAVGAPGEHKGDPLEQKRKELDNTIEVNAKTRGEVGKTLQAEMNALAALKKARTENALLEFNLPFSNEKHQIVADSEAAREMEIRIGVREKAVKSLQEQMNGLNAEMQHSIELQNKLGTGANPSDKALADRQKEIKALEQYDREQAVNQQRRDAQADILKRAETQFGKEAKLDLTVGGNPIGTDVATKRVVDSYRTEMLKAENKIAQERAMLVNKGVNEETLRRFDAMSAVERKKVEIQLGEKILAGLEAPNGMSAGVDRASAEGVRAVNRAVAGTASEQSLARESVRIAKDSLAKLEEIARQGDKPQVKTFGMAQ